MQGVYKVFNPLSIVINNKNLTPYKTQEKDQIAQISYPPL